MPSPCRSGFGIWGGRTELERRELKLRDVDLHADLGDFRLRRSRVRQQQERAFPLMRKALSAAQLLKPLCSNCSSRLVPAGRPSAFPSSPSTRRGAGAGCSDQSQHPSRHENARCAPECRSLVTTSLTSTTPRPKLSPSTLAACPWCRHPPRRYAAPRPRVDHYLYPSPPFIPCIYPAKAPGTHHLSLNCGEQGTDIPPLSTV